MTRRSLGAPAWDRCGRPHDNALLDHEERRDSLQLLHVPLFFEFFQFLFERGLWLQSFHAIIEVVMHASKAGGSLIACSALEKFGADSVMELRSNFDTYLRTARALSLPDGQGEGPTSLA